MIKYNLNELMIITEEEARFIGFACLTDFYLTMLAIHENEDINFVNSSIRQLKIRADSIKSVYKDINVFLLTKDKEYWDGTTNVYKRLAANYDRVKTMYPEFDDFILKIRNASLIKKGGI